MPRKTIALLLVLLLAAAAPGHAAARPGECTCVLCRSVAGGGGPHPSTGGLSEHPKPRVCGSFEQAVAAAAAAAAADDDDSWVRLPRTLY